METERQSIGFFDQLIYSVQPSKYKELIRQSGKQVLVYVLILSFLLTVMQFFIPVLGWFASFGGLDNFFQEVLPAIELQDGRLSVENKIEIGEDAATYILIDTERSSVSEQDLDKENYLAQIMVAEENAMIYNATMGVTEIRFADFGNLTLNNQGLTSLTPFIYLVLAISFVTYIMSQMFDLLTWGLMMALCCWGPFRLKGTIALKYGKIVALAIYAQSAMKLLNAFNACVKLIPDAYIFYYIGALVSMGLLMAGIRKLEENPYE